MFYDALIQTTCRVFFFLVRLFFEFGGRNSNGTPHASHPTVWNPESKDFHEKREVEEHAFYYHNLWVNMSCLKRSWCPTLDSYQGTVIIA